MPRKSSATERPVSFTNLDKLFWPKLGITKRDLIQYYLDVAPALLPHLEDRAMVMKRYPHGAGGEFFFMKRAPSPRPRRRGPRHVRRGRPVHDRSSRRADARPERRRRRRQPDRDPRQGDHIGDDLVLEIDEGDNDQRRDKGEQENGVRRDAEVQNGQGKEQSGQ